MVMAGGGLKGGQVYGKTDEIGWSIAENPVYLMIFKPLSSIALA